MNAATIEIMRTLQDTTASDPNALPEATDELITEYRNRFRVMTNPIGGGCLVSPQGEYNNGSDYYLLTQSQSMQVTNMIRLLLKRVDGDKAIMQDRTIDMRRIESLEVELKEATDRNAVLQNKIRKMATMHSDMAEVGNDQHQAVIRENQQLKAHLQVIRIEKEQLIHDKLPQCDETCRYTRQDLHYSRLIVNELQEEVRALGSELGSRKHSIEIYKKRLDHAKFFVRMLLALYPDVDPYHVGAVTKRVLKE
jgi:hypothetical protein